MGRYKPLSAAEEQTVSQSLKAIHNELRFLTDKEMSRLVELIRLAQMEREDDKIEAYAVSGFEGDSGELTESTPSIKGEVV